MTSSASPAPWLPRGLTCIPFVTPAAPALPRGRHLAAEVPGMVRIAAPEEVTRTGRHLEDEWSRPLHDPRRDEIDAFEWLGFGQY